MLSLLRSFLISLCTFYVLSAADIPSLESVIGITKVDESVKNCKFKFERIEAVYPSPADYKGKIVTRKYNRTTTVLDVYHEVITPLMPRLTKIIIKAYQFLSNTYRLTAIQLELDYCLILEAGSFGISEFSNNSNYPGSCPIKPGKYLTKNGKIPSDASTYINSVPKNFLGKWKLSLNYQLAGKTLYIYNYYFEAHKIVQWKKN